MDALVEQLAALGLGEYEARAWCALIAAPEPLTAYEAAKDAGIPSSKIYEVVARLQERGLVDLHEERGRKKYGAREPELFLEEARRRTETGISGVRSGLAALRQGRPSSGIWNINDLRSLMDRAVRLVSEARETILVSLAEPEAVVLEESLALACDRGIKCAVVQFGQVTLATGTVFAHPIADTLYHERGGRGFTLVADSREALVATVTDSRCDGAASSHKGFVSLAEDYIKHDIYVTKMVRRFDAELTRRFGANYALLRDVFSDKEES